MALLRPWVKSELKIILDSSNNGATVPRRPRTGRKHVQCIQVDEKHNALKINDGDTSVWCFVSTPGMKHFKDMEKNAPTFGSLNSKTITIEDWEFSTFSMLCPAFDRKEAAGQICILVFKLTLLCGERTTTVGHPTDLVEGDRDMRSIVRNLTKSNALMSTLARGQGMTDLRDIDGVLMSAAQLTQASKLSWNDVDPELLQESSVETDGQMANPSAAENDHPETATTAAKTPQDNNASDRHKTPMVIAQEDTQQSLGMEYEGESQEGQYEFQTQENLAGNVFIQEAMEIQSASPMLSPPSRDADGAAGWQALSASPGPPSPEELSVPRPEVSSVLGNSTSYDDAPLGQESTPANGKTQSWLESSPSSTAVTPSPSPSQPKATVDPRHSTRGTSGTMTEVEGDTMTTQESRPRDNKPDAKETGAGKARDKEEEGSLAQEDNSADTAPIGLTQLDHLAGGALSPPAPPDRQEGRKVPAKAGDEAHEAVRPQKLRRSRVTRPANKGEAPRGSRARSPRGRGRGGARGGGRGAGKGKANASGRTTTHPVGSQKANYEQGSGEESPTVTPRGKGKGKARERRGLKDAGAAASSGQDALGPQQSQNESLSQSLSGQTSSSSNVVTPSRSQLDLSCLTQERTEEGMSGARAASRKCDIRRRFSEGQNRVGSRVSPRGKRNRQKDMREDNDFHTSRDPDVGSGRLAERGRKSGGVSLEKLSSPKRIRRDTYEYHAGHSDCVLTSTRTANLAASMLPMQPLRGGDRQGRKRTCPLSDLVITVDPAWDGTGRIPVVARGYEADEMMAKWLDEEPAGFPEPMTIADWLEGCDRATHTRHNKGGSTEADPGDEGLRI